MTSTHCFIALIVIAFIAASIIAYAFFTVGGQTESFLEDLKNDSDSDYSLHTK